MEFLLQYKALILKEINIASRLSILTKASYYTALGIVK